MNEMGETMMIKVALVGIGAMGRGHYDNYIRLMDEGFPVKLVAICDIDPDRLKGKGPGGIINTGIVPIDADRFAFYTDYDTMLASEQLDYVDIALPTYLHAEASLKALDKGLHVLCEKPMARTVDECRMIIEASRRNDRKLMIGQCLRFWPEYEYLKACVDDGRYGEVMSGYFFRGGGTPRWSFENWLLNKAKSGGCLLDQHIHDVDTINWLFGMPEAVSTLARVVVPGSGYDAVSTNYRYPDGKVINAQDDWTLNGEFGFTMQFRVNFETGNLLYGSDGLKAYPNEGTAFVPELSKNQGYYYEIRYFINAIIHDTAIVTAAPESTMDTIRIAEAEELSADRKGEMVLL